jgi:hypothetical protein
MKSKTRRMFTCFFTATTALLLLTAARGQP